MRDGARHRNECVPTPLRRFGSASAPYRRNECVSEADIYRGGSAKPIALADCELARNRAHLRELVAFEQVLRGR